MKKQKKDDSRQDIVKRVDALAHTYFELERPDMPFSEYRDQMFDRVAAGEFEEHTAVVIGQGGAA